MLFIVNMYIIDVWTDAILVFQISSTLLQLFSFWKISNLLFFIWRTLFFTFIKCVWICHNLWKYLYPHIIITRSMKSIHVPHRQKWHTRCFILLKTILKPTFNHPSCPWLFKPIKKNLKYFYQGVKADCVYNACAIILTDDGGSLYENQTVWILWLHHFCKF